MNRFLLGSVVLVAVSACSDGGANDVDAHRELGTTAEAIDGPTEIDACPQGRWVGLASTTCPAAPPVPASANAKWVQSQVLGGANATLARYCAYDWVPTGSGPVGDPAQYTGTLPADGARAALTWLAPDCRVAAPLGISDPTGPLRVAESADALAAIDVVHITGTIAAPARVALIDTSPDTGTGTPVVGASEHGYTLHRLVENVGCPKDDAGTATGRCAVHAASHLGMPYVSGDVRDEVHGGYYGRQTDVAAAIVRAVDAWHAGNPALTKERLVINLSLGWESRWDTTSSGAARPSATAVRDALFHAACSGALVFAAVGNDGGGSVPATGAMSPAAWTTLQLAVGSVCNGFEPAGYGTTVPQPITGDARRPIVYAVGGVDAGDQPIANARAHTGTPLVAYASNGTGRVPVGSTERAGTSSATTTVTAARGTTPLTGTSVASALVAATAAEMWAVRPDLPPEAIVAQLIASGTTLPGLSADVCASCGPGKTPVPVKRLDHCAAIAAVCAGGHCGDWAPSCAARAGFVAGTAHVNAELLAALVGELSAVPPIEVTTSSTSSKSPSVCGDTSYFASTVPGTAAHCPSHEASDIVDAPWGGPQPGYPPCPSCGMVRGCPTCTSGVGGSSSSAASTVTVVGRLSPFLGTLGAPTLRVRYTDGSVSELDLAGNVKSLDSAHPFKLAIAVPNPTKISSVTLNAIVTNAAGRTTSAVIPVLTPRLVGSRSSGFRLEASDFSLQSEEVRSL